MDNELYLKENFNEEQIKAIKSDFPLTIIAGPGSGKTTTIVEKILQNVQIEEDLKNTLIVTFTNEASRNILMRIKKKLNVDFLNPKNYYIGTFHSIFYKFLNEKQNLLQEEFGFQKKITIVEQNDDLKIFLKFCNKYYNIDGKLNKKQLDEKFVEIQYMTTKDFYYKVNKETINDNSSIEYILNNLLHKCDAFESKDRELYMNIIKDFFQYKTEEGLMNFNDILMYSYLLVNKNSEFRKSLNKNFKYIYIDEYQDTNPIQDKLINSIKNLNDCEVGDGYQSIYKFLNARIENILNLINEPGRNVVQLTKNYRSSPNIVEFTNDLTTLFKDKIPNYQPCTSENKEVKNLKIQFKEYVNQEYKILEHIQKSIREGIPHKEIAIISRTNFETAKMEKLLLEKKIPFIKLSGKGFYERKEITLMIDILKVLSGNYNVINFENIAEYMPGLGAKTLDKLTDEYIHGKKKNLKKLIEENFKKNDKLQFLSNLLLDVEELDFYTFKKVFHHYDLKIVEQLIDSSSTTYGKKEIQKNIEIFLDEIEEILLKDSKQELEEFLSIVSLDKKDRNKDREHSIVITTAHSAKGLEWNNCYILNCTEGKFPSAKSLGFKEELEEEKRLFYVAVSRAKEFLMITSEQELNSFASPFKKQNYSEYETVQKNNFWF